LVFQLGSGFYLKKARELELLAIWHLKFSLESIVISTFRNCNSKIDIYALGVCIYQLIHGKNPFRGNKE